MTARDARFDRGARRLETKPLSVVSRKYRSQRQQNPSPGIQARDGSEPPERARAPRGEDEGAPISGRRDGWRSGRALEERAGVETERAEPRVGWRHWCGDRCGDQELAVHEATMLRANEDLIAREPDARVRPQGMVRVGRYACRGAKTRSVFSRSGVARRGSA